MTDNWNNFPTIKAGDTVMVTWSEKFYGMQEQGHAVGDKNNMIIDFGSRKVPVDAIRANENIERTEIVW